MIMTYLKFILQREEIMKIESQSLIREAKEMLTHIAKESISHSHNLENRVNRQLHL